MTNLYRNFLTVTVALSAALILNLGCAVSSHETATSKKSTPEPAPLKIVIPQAPTVPTPEKPSSVIKLSPEERAQYCAFFLPQENAEETQRVLESLNGKWGETPLLCEQPGDSSGDPLSVFKLDTRMNRLALPGFNDVFTTHVEVTYRRACVSQRLADPGFENFRVVEWVETSGAISVLVIKDPDANVSKETQSIQIVKALNYYTQRDAEDVRKSYSTELLESSYPSPTHPIKVGTLNRCAPSVASPK